MMDRKQDGMSIAPEFVGRIPICQVAVSLASSLMAEGTVIDRDASRGPMFLILLATIASSGRLHEPLVYMRFTES